MKKILEQNIGTSEAALWWLGQAGYVVRAAGLTVVIDPYLSDSAAGESGEFSRRYPPPIQPEELSADIYIITHDHLDHLDPETLAGYKRKNDTWFVTPRFCAEKLASLGIPEKQIAIVNAGESWSHGSATITGCYAIPTGTDVLDTTGYLVQFANGRSFYHTSDTQFHSLVLDAAPRKPELMLVPINGKWKNPGPEQAVEFARAVQPRHVVPNHYDLMELNSENPEIFEWLCNHGGLTGRCLILERMQPFTWRQQ